jgi:hypothetical protein
MNIQGKKHGMDPSYLIQFLRDSTLFKRIIDFFDWAVDVSPAFIHFLTDSLNTSYLGQVERTEDHTCCERLFSLENEQLTFNKELRELEE